jgi:bifunctional DNA-binding transcriptional regulator/antitoxin component of YhaV-PrlF toxin-antitoxin module
MILRTRKTTRMDQSGRVFLDVETRRLMGLRNQGPVEFYVNGDGQTCLRALKSLRNKKFSK